MAADFAYLRVRPSEESLPADRITGQFEQLHRALDTPIECLLVSDAGNEEVAYYFGTTPRASGTLFRILNRLTPDSYRIDDVEDNPLPELDAPTAAEFHGIGERAQDWQTRLRPPSLADAPEQHDTARVEAAPNLPLESVVQGMATTNSTVVYQALLTPKLDWSGDAEYRIRRLDQNRDTVGQRLFKSIFGSIEDDEERHSPRRSAHRRGDSGSIPGTRIDAILAKSSRNSFDINARLLADGPDAETTLRDLASTFNAIGGDFYDVRATLDSDADALNEAIENRTVKDGTSLTRTLTRKFPLAPNNSPRIVADSTTVPHFCLLDGASLTDAARRSLRSIPAERTGITPPDDDKLAYYETGLPLGRPLAQDGTAHETPVALPPSLQPMHVAWFGKTGSGKTTALENAILQNHAATDGADILIAPKGDGMPTEYLRAHFAEYGTLENVYYFDCAETLPAFSFFDIRDQLTDGVSRTTAVQDVVDHYIEVLRGVMSEENFESAVRSPDVIRYLVKALFDPEYGADAYTHRDLQRATRQLRESKTPPQVTDDDLRGMLTGVTENDKRAFDAIMQGVANRIEKIPLDERLGRVFNHIPSEDTPAFDLRDILDENAVVIFDLGGLRPQSQRALTLVVLSKLWTALQRRKQMDENPPLVNLYLEEAASLAVSELLTDLLAQSRGFTLSVTLAMQFPAQLREQAPRTYDEVMNNVGSIVTGNVAVDTHLQQRLATEAMPAEEVGNRLRALSRGEWLTSLAAPFGEPRPQPFVMQSLPLPPGHLEGDKSLSEPRELAFQALVDAVEERTRERHGLSLEGKSTRQPQTPEQARKSTSADSVLSYTDRLPACVAYDEQAHALVCGACGARYDAAIDGMRRAISCCHDLEAVDRDSIPICELSLTLTPNERLDSGYSTQQLLFLQAVYNAQHGRFDPLEYDLLRDSMDLLQAYTGVADAAITELIDAGLLRNDGDYVHQLYTVTHEGRKLLHEPHREGDTHGHGKGDVAESSYHTVLVELGRRYIEQAFVDDTDSPVVEAQSYYDVPDGEGRFDAVGLDADGRIVVSLEAERSNNDLAEAVPADFDKMAAVDPDEAIWVVRTQAIAHEVLGALNHPSDGQPRVEKTYSENSPPSRWTIDEPGFSQVRTVSQLQRELDRD
ncbi:ATP-binding protein [Natronomonas sp. EA1]|uniref:ATP-binding protein n=1 Tax=Natronomonas sp. EA1 TaxID=3421655 RepID=UPI003EB999BD